MKIAFVHDRLYPGGALEVFKTLIQQERKAHPDAEMKVFTMIADQDLKRLTLQIPGTANQGTITVVEALPQRVSNLFTTSSRQRIPIFSVLFDYRNLIIFYPRIMHLLSRKIRRFQPESILISSFAIAKNITLSCLSGRGGKARAFRQPITKLYLHSPMQYIWSHREEYLAKFTGRKKMLFTFLVPRLQKWDKQFTQFNEVSFNSTYTQRLAKEIYGLEGKVVYPNIHDAFYFAGVNLQPQEYFVCVGRLVSFVRECDLIINAFNQLKLPLLMVGAGPDEVFLKSIAKDTILFLGRLSPEETQKIVRNAKALINLTKESFGMGTVEALLMGVPVIGFNDGATPELVDSQSGILLEQKTIKNLILAVEQFQKKTWDRKAISERIREKLIFL